MPRIMVAVLWTCPRCGNFYGSSSAGDLRADMNTDLKGEPTFPRSRCPDCTKEGLTTDRVPVKVEYSIDGAVE